MLHLKVAVIDDKYGDVQLVECGEGAAHSFPVTHIVNQQQAWAIKNPSPQLIPVVTTLVPDSKLTTIRHVPFLLSPKAIQHFPNQRSNRHLDVAFITFHMPGEVGTDFQDLHFVMAHLQGKHFWHLPWCDTTMTQTLNTTVTPNTTLNTTVTPNTVNDGTLGIHILLQNMFQGYNSPSKLVSKWKVLKQHHQVTDFKTFIHFRMFHTHVQFEEVVRFLRGIAKTTEDVERLVVKPDQIVADQLGNNQTFEPLQVQTIDVNHDIFQSIMIVSKKALLTGLPKIIQNVQVDQWHINAVKRYTKS